MAIESIRFPADQIKIFIIYLILSIHILMTVFEESISVDLDKSENTIVNVIKSCFSKMRLNVALDCSKS